MPTAERAVFDDPQDGLVEMHGSLLVIIAEEPVAERLPGEPIDEPRGLP